MYTARAAHLHLCQNLLRKKIFQELSCQSDFYKPNFFHQFIKKVRHAHTGTLISEQSVSTGVCNVSKTILQPPIEDEHKTPDLVFRYQMEQGDIQEVLQRDMNALNALIQVNSQIVFVDIGCTVKKYTLLISISINLFIYVYIYVKLKTNYILETKILNIKMFRFSRCW